MLQIAVTPIIRNVKEELLALISAALLFFFATYTAVK